MESANTNFFVSEGKSWDDLGGGVFRQVMGYNQDLMMVKFRFTKGGVGAPHHHIHTQGAVVLSGVFELTINGVSTILKAGDGYFIEANKVHSALCLEDGELIDAFTPARQDFLK